MKVALLSFAHVHAAGYARLLRARPDIELIASDPEPGSVGEVRGRRLADDLGVSYVDSYEEAFATGPDAVVICAENSRHRGLTERAAGAGAHVLCEKPLATTLSDARAMIDACAAAGVNLMTAYPVRFHPAFALLADRVAAGALGQIRSAAGSNNGRAPIAARRWFVDPELAGGGAVMDHTVHLADLLDRLLGQPVVEVYAQANRVVHAEEVSVETGGLVMITYASGVVATIDCSWNRPRSAPVGGGLRLSIDGDAGNIEFDAFSDSLIAFDDAAPAAVPVRYGANLDALMLDEFFAAIAEDRPAQPDGEVGFRTLQVVLAAYESIRSGQPVVL